MNDDEVFVTITREEYDSLLEDSWFLSCLEDAGVDNWSGYDEAIRMRNEGSQE